MRFSLSMIKEWRKLFMKVFWDVETLYFSSFYSCCPLSSDVVRGVDVPSWWPVFRSVLDAGWLMSPLIKTSHNVPHWTMDPLDCNYIDCLLTKSWEKGFILCWITGISTAQPPLYLDWYGKSKLHQKYLKYIYILHLKELDRFDICFSRFHWNAQTWSPAIRRDFNKQGARVNII